MNHAPSSQQRQASHRCTLRLLSTLRQLFPCLCYRQRQHKHRQPLLRPIWAKKFSSYIDYLCFIFWTPFSFSLRPAVGRFFRLFFPFRGAINRLPLRYFITSAQAAYASGARRQGGVVLPLSYFPPSLLPAPSFFLVPDRTALLAAGLFQMLLFIGLCRQVSLGFYSARRRW